MDLRSVCLETCTPLMSLAPPRKKAVFSFYRQEPKKKFLFENNNRFIKDLAINQSLSSHYIDTICKIK
jgi:hypothetical protein